MNNYFNCSMISACASVLSLSLATIASPVSAADLGPAPSEQFLHPAPSQWEFRFTPYAWATSVNGSTTAADQTVDIDVSFIDVVQESDSIAALMGYFEARNGRLALYTDAVWSNLSFSGERSGTGPLGLLDISVDGELDYQQFIIEAGIAYEIARFPGDPVSLKDDFANPTSFTAIDILAGARYWHESVDLSFDITTGLIDPPAGFEVRGDRVVGESGAIDWIDPVVGLRMRHQFSPGQELQLRGDVGGFGVGSDFSWQLFGGYGFAFGESWSGVIGYRALSVDYSEEGPNGTRGIDLLQHGPVFGVNFRW